MDNTFLYLGIELDDHGDIEGKDLRQADPTRKYGPLRPISRLAEAAVQLIKIGHWGIVQHFEMVSQGCADRSEFAAITRMSTVEVV